MRRIAHAAMYAGVVGIVLVLSALHAERIGDYDLMDSSRFAWGLAFALLLCVIAYGLGLPDAPRSARDRFSSAVLAAGIGVLAVSLVQLAIGDRLLPRFVVFGTGLALIPWYMAVAGMSGYGRTSLEQRDRVLIVAHPQQVEELVRQLQESPERPATIVGEVSCEDASSTDRSLVDAAMKASASVLVLNAVALADERVVEQAATLHERGMRVRTLSWFYEEWLGKLPVADLERATLFFDISDVHRERFGRWKRVFDVALGGLGLLALAVLVPIVWLANRVGNRGPLFYVQERVGRNEAVFRMIKFRTMREDTSSSADWTSEKDPRITPFGRVLRLTHLDELPQVWNVLRGDLSIVGPRPEQPRYVAELAEKLPYYHLRHAVRPGLTGWAQVKYGYANTEGDALEKLQYEFHYLRRQSLLFDLRIVGRTVRTVIGRKGH